MVMLTKGIFRGRDGSGDCVAAAGELADHGVQHLARLRRLDGRDGSVQIRHRRVDFGQPGLQVVGG